MKAPSTFTWHLTVVVSLAAILLLTNLGGPRLWDDDESRNAGCAVEMLLRGDWIVPIFNAELRAHKPVLTYWCMIVAYKLGGVNEFTARLPSAIAAMGTLILTYCIGRRLFNARTGLWSAIALGCSITFCMTGRAATPDSILVFTCTLAIALFVFGTFARRTVTNTETGEIDDQLGPLQRYKGHWFPQRTILVVMLYAAMGLAVLAKGPVGLVLPTAVIGMFLLIQRLAPMKEDVDQDDEAGEIRQMMVPLWLQNAARPFGPFHFLRTCWYMWPITAIVMTLLIAGPWYAAVGLQTEGNFISEFFGTHYLKRATTALEGHKGFPGFYPVMLIAGFFPFSVFALPVVVETWHRIARKDPWQPGYLLAVCWICVYIGIFSIARTKLVNYIAPCFPAAALLVGAFIDRWLADKLLVARWWPAVAFAALALVGVGMLIGGYAVGDKLLPGEQQLGLIGILPIAAGLIAIGRNLFNFDRRWTAGFVTVCCVAMTTLVFALAAQRVDAHRQDQQLVTAIFAREAKPKLASFRILEPSWVYYAKQPILELPKVDPAANQATKQNQVFAKMNDNKQAVRFLSKDPAAYMITTREQFEVLQPHLPADVTVIAEQPLFLKDKKLVVLGRQKANVVAQTPAVKEKR
ncbi:Undecaprenyl phosphate-alpha-4-amino-4-deoxy-L-arabinose arabinosyl transferase [Anatilimnocola aggregata]|uniref:Undecaprenyl phosphate-alpha-4-amino-4-deoxy-L-arabinose arabinosyl transferase n=1 Tax=Anatilimnocola aggregata TaxID=2528021 RepID=A0A517YP11_9BACT|nr:glycosyltransferase family 39 protein [Anatilimnocola aggregata]QDU31965.1 Undecaprenyl phosphate-alpha-4-amino-4-deoxy-L-arabinose arabinosyl transferase [Anatilimnocola aggregata]